MVSFCWLRIAACSCSCSRKNREQVPASTTVQNCACSTCDHNHINRCQESWHREVEVRHFWGLVQQEVRSSNVCAKKNHCVTDARAQPEVDQRLLPRAPSITDRLEAEDKEQTRVSPQVLHRAGCLHPMKGAGCVRYPRLQQMHHLRGSPRELS